MHALRNAQSALECKLQYLMAMKGDDEEVAEALQDAIEGYRRTITLTYEVVQDLRLKGFPAPGRRWSGT